MAIQLIFLQSSIFQRNKKTDSNITIKMQVLTITLSFKSDKFLKWLEHSKVTSFFLKKMYPFLNHSKTYFFRKIGSFLLFILIWFTAIKCTSIQLNVLWWLYLKTWQLIAIYFSVLSNCFKLLKIITAILLQSAKIKSIKLNK